MPEQIHALDDAVKKPNSVWITDWCADIWEPTMAHHLHVQGRHSRDPTVRCLEVEGGKTTCFSASQDLLVQLPSQLGIRRAID